MVTETVIDVSSEQLDEVIAFKGGHIEVPLMTVSLRGPDGRILNGVPILTAAVTGNQSKNRMLLFSVNRDAMSSGKEKSGSETGGSTAAGDGTGPGPSLPAGGPGVERPDERGGKNPKRVQ